MKELITIHDHIDNTFYVGDTTGEIVFGNRMPKEAADAIVKMNNVLLFIAVDADLTLEDAREFAVETLSDAELGKAA